MPLTYRQLGPLGVRQAIDASLADLEQIRRRTEYSRRALIMADRFGPLIHQRIASVYRRQSTIERLSQFVDAGTNVMASVVRDLAFVYTRPPVRTLRVDGPVGEALNIRLAAGHRESQIAVKAKQWGSYAFAMNLIWVLPGVWDRVTGRMLEYQMILPHTAERITSDDPRHTDVLLWPRGPREADGSVPAGWHAVDSEAYYWLEKDFRVERMVPHGLGRQPAVELRVSAPPPDDYWNVGRGSKLVTATVECGRIGAAMSWVRAAQNRKLVTVFGDIKGMDRDQAGSPESAITAATQAPESISLAVHDFVTAIGEFREEMRWHAAQAVESYFGPDHEQEGAKGAPSPEMHAAQSELRNDQIDYARPFEHELAVNSAALQARFGHQHSIAPEIVASAFECRWAPLTFIDHPLNRIKVYEAKMALGLMSHADAWVEEYGGNVTAEQAQERVLENLERKAAVDLFYSKHNLGADPRIESVPQMQGREGGQAKADEGKQS